MKPTPATNSAWAFQAYENVRARLPEPEFTVRPQLAANLGALADQFDAFLLDAFGVLNIGETAIPGAIERVAELQKAGKQVMVITNAASYPKPVLMQRYAKLGFSFAPDQVVSSREVLLQHLRREAPRHWGLMALPQFGREEFEDLNTTFLADDPAVYDAVEGILCFGSGDWSEARQELLQASLKRNPRPVLVGNPDIVAPREGGLSREPGHYAHRLADLTGIAPHFCGKPFADIYDLAISRLPSGIDKSRVLMVGDTLHTDILGGRTAGMKTALITGYGSLKGLNVEKALEASGITPDYILPGP